MGLTLPSDLFPENVVGSVTGLSGLAAGLIGAGFTLLVGHIVDQFSYRPAFLAAGLMPILATIFLYLLIKPRAEVSTSTQ
jgi:ACS family hexuronate transporter-like MFS transporter